MALTIELTPGKQFAVDELADREGLNLLGKPSVLLDGDVGHSDLEDEAVHANNVYVEPYFYAEEAGPGSDAIAITLNPPLRALASGVVVHLKTASVKTPAATLNVNGLGPKPVRKRGGLPILDGDLRGGIILELAYNATLESGGGAWELLSLTGNNEDRYATSAGTGTAYTVTTTPTVTALSAGVRVAFKAHAANTGAATLAVDGLTAKPLRKEANTALAANDIAQNSAILAIYDATLDVFLLLSPVTPFSPGRVYAQGTPTATALAGTDTKVGTITLALPTGKVWKYLRVGFSTLLQSDSFVGGGNSIRNVSCKIASDALTMVGLTPPAAIPVDNSDDNLQVTTIMEGNVHASHLADASLVVDVYAQTALVVDTVAYRSCYAVGEYQ
jgi:hypothetical protein